MPLCRGEPRTPLKKLRISQIWINLKTGASPVCIVLVSSQPALPARSGRPVERRRRGIHPSLGQRPRKA